MTFSGVPPTTDGPFTLRIDQHMAKFGINYRFGGFGSPVVAILTRCIYIACGDLMGLN